MLNTILFDLDGTLLELDLDYFLKQYFKAISTKLAPLFPVDEFVPKLLRATKVMMHSVDPQKYNEEVFFADFLSQVPYKKEEIMPLFNEFYKEDFALLKQYTKSNPMARSVVEKAMGKGYDVVVATQPVFPIEAIQHRLAWAGVGDLPFKLVTSYEQCHFCKPQPAYFQEILDKLGRRAEECMMVGNDVDDDLPSGEIGIKTYLVTDCLLNRKNRQDYNADYTGSMKDLYKFIENLPQLK